MSENPTISENKDWILLREAQVFLSDSDSGEYIKASLYFNTVTGDEFVVLSYFDTRFYFTYNDLDNIIVSLNYLLYSE